MESFASVDPAHDYATLQSEFKEVNFTEDTYAQPKFIRITSGSPLRLRCSAVGYPFPELMWIKVLKKYSTPLLLRLHLVKLTLAILGQLIYKKPISTWVLEFSH